MMAEQSDGKTGSIRGEDSKTDETVVEKPQRRRLTTSCRRRLKRLLGEGVSYELALADALKSLSATANVNATAESRNKRNRSSNDSAEEIKKKPKSNKSAEGAKGKPRPTYSAVSKAFQVGIVPIDYPKRRLSPTEITNAKLSILQLIAEQRKTLKVKPRFTMNPSAREGWFIVYCQDLATSLWIKGQIHWISIGCKVVDANAFPEEIQVLGHFRFSAELKTDFILQVLEGQNDLVTDTWKEVYRKNEGSLAIIKLAIDADSLETLKESQFAVQYGFGQTVKLKQCVRGKDEKKQEGEAPKKPSHVSETSISDGDHIVSEHMEIEPVPPPVEPSEQTRADQTPKSTGSGGGLGPTSTPNAENPVRATDTTKTVIKQTNALLSNVFEQATSKANRKKKGTGKPPPITKR